MKAILEKVITIEPVTLKVEFYSKPRFEMPYHYHPENEMVLITKGEGFRYVGDHCEPFEPDDLVLIKGNVPHFWESPRDRNSQRRRSSAESVYIQFPDSVFPQNFRQMVEFKCITEVLEKSGRGIKITHPLKNSLVSQVKGMLNLPYFERLVRLYEILNMIGSSQDYELLCSPEFSGNITDSDSVVINKVYSALLENFKTNLTLDQLAVRSNMNKSALCRYFKQKTGSPIIDMLVKIRVGHACRLISNNVPIPEACFESGFNTIENFNKMFRRHIGKSPGEFKKSNDHFS